mmetsp:Transcript_52931/g.133112  ORF Transcript_52931/g.133112 Transcript_52931/m.133112 type:complete len:406 (-) Transcript_52931:410-1627(-)
MTRAGMKAPSPLAAPRSRVDASTCTGQPAWRLRRHSYRPARSALRLGASWTLPVRRPRAHASWVLLAPPRPYSRPPPPRAHPSPPACSASTPPRLCTRALWPACSPPRHRRRALTPPTRSPQRALPPLWHPQHAHRWPAHRLWTARTRMPPRGPARSACRAAYRTVGRAYPRWAGDGTRCTFSGWRPCVCSCAPRSALRAWRRCATAASPSPSSAPRAHAATVCWVTWWRSRWEAGGAVGAWARARPPCWAALADSPTCWPTRAASNLCTPTPPACTCGCRCRPRTSLPRWAVWLARMRTRRTQAWCGACAAPRSRKECWIPRSGLRCRFRAVACGPAARLWWPAWRRAPARAARRLPPRSSCAPSVPPHFFGRPRIARRRPRRTAWPQAAWPTCRPEPRGWECS